MINFNFTLRNPWSDRFEPLVSRGGKLSKHKAWEVELYRCDSIAEIEAKFTIREDHAGIVLGLGLFSYVIQLQWYDTRHWNYATHQWEMYE